MVKQRDGQSTSPVDCPSPESATTFPLHVPNPGLAVLAGERGTIMDETVLPSAQVSPRDI